jgi:predicted enzyme related to lactoylglutathione lyase
MAAMSNRATPNPVSWFEVHTADPERSKAFYASVFGWSYDDSMPGYSMIQLGDGAPIGGGIADSGGGYPNDAVFMVEVPDVATALASAAEHGGSVVADVQSTPFGLTFGYAANPDGSVFGVFCPPAEG